MIFGFFDRFYFAIPLYFQGFALFLRWRFFDDVFLPRFYTCFSFQKSLFSVIFPPLFIFNTVWIFYFEIREKQKTTLLWINLECRLNAVGLRL